MTAFFRDGNVYYVLVEGNAESLYYLVKEDSTIIGLNKTESAYLSMDIEGNKIKKLKMWSSTSAVTNPLPLLKPDELHLKGFIWLDYLRPSSSDDIFRINERRGSEAVEPRQKRFEREDITL